MGCSCSSAYSKKKYNAQLPKQTSVNLDQNNPEEPPKLEYLNPETLLFKNYSLSERKITKENFLSDIKLDISKENKFQEKCVLKNNLTSEDLDIKNQTFISRGAFGDVIKIGLKSNDSLNLAVKIMNVDNIDSDSLDSIKREIEIHELLSKQRIKPQALPKYFGYFRQSRIGSKSEFYLCFECLPYTLDFFIKEHIKHKTLISNQLLIKQFNTLVNALSYLQMLGICHRDLKPKNILMDESKENLTLIDFGISKIFDILNTETKIYMDLAGNRMFMSPELMRAFERNDNDVEINPFKSDAFSFGLVFYKLWTLRMLSDKMNQKTIDEELKILELNIIIEPVASVRIRLQKMLGILQKCLRVNAGERCDFLRIYKENFNFDQKKKIRLHMMVEVLEKTEDLNEIFDKSNIFFIFFDWIFFSFSKNVQFC